MSMCGVISCVVGQGCLLWPVCSLGKTLLVFALVHFVLQGQTCLLLLVCLDFPLLHINPLWWKGYIYIGVVEGLVGLHRIIQLQLLCHQQLGHRLGLLWCWMACLVNKPRSFCCFWHCTQVLHFRFFCWLWGLFYFFWRILTHSCR